jgi:hypothetical protein
MAHAPTDPRPSIPAPSGVAAAGRRDMMALSISPRGLWCSRTTCRDWSGASPDDGRCPVHPSRLTPRVGRGRPAPNAGVTRSAAGGGDPPVVARPEGRANARAAAGSERCSVESGSPSGMAGRDGARWGGRRGHRPRAPGIAASTQRAGAATPSAEGRRHGRTARQGQSGRSRGALPARPPSEGPRSKGRNPRSPRGPPRLAQGVVEARRAGTAEPGRS